MGHRRIGTGRVHPLTVLDDHARFALGLVACAHEPAALVQTHLITLFQRSGLPDAILADNGPTGGSSTPGVLTWLAAWLIRRGIRVLHGRPYHPQTQGKIERWQATIATDVFPFGPFADLAATQRALAAFRHTYHTDRPHEALGMAVPITRYQPSSWSYPEVLPEIVSSADDPVRTVTRGGWIWFDRQRVELGEALRGLPAGIRSTGEDDTFVVRFCNQDLKRVHGRPPS